MRDHGRPFRSIDRRRVLQAGLLGAVGYGLLPQARALASTASASPPPQPWIDVTAWGAKGDGSTDDVGAIQGAIAALGSSGGVIFFPPGTYRCSGALDLDARNSISLVGMANPTAGVAAASVIRFDGAGPGAFISAGSSAGVEVRNLMILYTSKAFTGTLVDYRNQGGLDTVFGVVDGCYLGSLPAGLTSASLVALDKSHSMALTNNVFRDGATGIVGRAASSYANRILIQANYFSGNQNEHIRNPGESWVIQSNTFEHLAGGRGGACAFEPNVSGNGVSFLGNWFGDVTPDAGGSQLAWSGDGLLVVGNFIGVNSGATGIKITTDGCKGIVVMANDFVGWGTCTGIDFGTTSGHQGVQVGPNVYSTISTKIGGVIPDGLVEDTGTPGRWLVASAKTLRAEHVASRRPSGGASGDIKVGTGKIWVNDRGTWKSVKIS